MAVSVAGLVLANSRNVRTFLMLEVAEHPRVKLACEG